MPGDATRAAPKTASLTAGRGQPPGTPPPSRRMIEIAAPMEMRSWSRQVRIGGRRVALVPTMGYLHEGHLRLADLAGARCDAVVMSVFVNPLQFGAGEDLDRYPRDIDRDRSQAEGRCVDVLFVPTVESIYPKPPVVRVSPGALAQNLCGPHRPGHFEGVLTVVAKLFNIVEPDVAVFGRKDYQQAALIRRMVQDLDMSVEVAIAPTVREADGLAMSSRNAYLDPPARRAATVLARALNAAHRTHSRGEIAAGRLLASSARVLSGEPAVEVEYLEIVDPEDLTPVETAADDSIVAVAARVGGTRLIDNIVLGQGLDADGRLEDDHPPS